MRFNEQTHTYVGDGGELYLSATSFIKKFCKPFERDKIAAKYAKKHKKTVQEVIDEWTKLGDDAVKKGTAYHKIKEDELYEKPFVFIDEIEHPIFKPTWEDGDKVSEMKKLEIGIYPELMVWSDRYKIAGQADRVEICSSGKINIIDYKTSKEIKTRGFEKWDGSVEMLKFPLNHLEDCNFNQYALQLNLYAFLIRQHNRNLNIGSISIHHVKGDYDESAKSFQIKETIVYEVPKLQDDIRVALEYYKNQMYGN